MPHPVLEAAARYRAQLLANERQAATRLVRAYGRAFASLRDQTEALQQQLASLPDPQQADVARLASLRSLMRQMQAEVERYAAVADAEIVRGVQASIDLGLAHSVGLVEAHFSADGLAAVRARWDMLPAEQVETLLGFTAPDSPLRTRLVGRLGEAVATRVADALVDAIATGTNPRQVAQLIRREMGQGLTWSLTTARTAQIWAYREASRANYMANRSVVSGWRWLSALDSRTCLSCLSQHGALFPVDAVLNGHHGCRCTMVPVVAPLGSLAPKPPVIEAGEAWFKRQKRETQRAMMGERLLVAWQNGQVPFDALSRAYSDPVYGTMLRRATVQELIGK